MDIEGWLTDAQADVLSDRARELAAPDQIVEIGSYRGRSAVVLATAAPAGVQVVAIDPHAGNDRGPQQIHGSAAEGQRDHEAFLRNLEVAGVRDQVRHVRRTSQDALSEVEGAAGVVYVDGAHRYGPARADIEHWGARVRPDGTLLIHDAFSSIGVTLAIVRLLFFGREYVYARRTGSLAEYRREPVRGVARVSNGLRQAAQLPWFARNVLVKIALLTRLRPLARLLGHRGTDWPY
jgi:predicted O-methyltransferase YrrM